MRAGFDGGILPNLREAKIPNVRSTRLPLLIALLVIVAAATWYYSSRRATSNGESIAVYYTKLDGTSLGDVRVSLRPRQPDESAAEHLHNAVLYAAVQAVAGPPNEIKAIRFPPGTRVLSVGVDGQTATVDLSKEVEQQAGGSFGENGEFKGLVYTVTGLRGIDAVQVTVDGTRLETLPGGHLELDQPLHRSDW
jgi:spore germination protein GerM